MKPAIIINTSNLQKGGALQVATSFVQEASRIGDVDFHIILGKASSKLNLPQKFEEHDHLRFYTVDIHPGESALKLFKFRKLLSAIEHVVKPDAVITVFGPCYWKPEAPHIMGFANGYLLYEDTYFFKVWHGWKSLRYRLKKRFHKYLLKTEANWYWTETADSKIRLARFLDKPLDHIILASNNCSHFFREGNYEQTPDLPPKKATRLLYLSSYYPHKGFELVPPVLRGLKEKGIDVELVVTIDREAYNSIFSGFENVTNLGTVDPAYCPWLYQQSDIVFVPTLLETFTAIYPEAMYLGKPIVTTDLPFARDTCGDAALFFETGNPDDAINKLVSIIEDAGLRNQLAENGFKKILDFDLPGQRFRKVLDAVMPKNFK